MTRSHSSCSATPRTLFEVGLIIVLAAAPLIAQVLRVPSILLLLALGFGAGAIGALGPNALLGEAVVSAVVSISVGFILFDSGLDLKLNDLRGEAVAHVYSRLVTFGIVATWAGRHRRVLPVVRPGLGGGAGARRGARRFGADGGRAASRLHPSFEDGQQGSEVGGNAGRSDRRVVAGDSLREGAFGVCPDNAAEAEVAGGGVDGLGLPGGRPVAQTVVRRT
jgi:hypothetical protein